MKSNSGGIALWLAACVSIGMALIWALAARAAFGEFGWMGLVYVAIPLFFGAGIGGLVGILVSESASDLAAGLVGAFVGLAISTYLIGVLLALVMLVRLIV